MKIPSVPKLAIGAFVFIATAALIIPIPFGLRPVCSITLDQAKATLAEFRTCLKNSSCRLPSSLSSVANEKAPFILTVWSGGVRNRVFQTQDDETLTEAFFRIKSKLARIDQKALSDPSMRLQLDFAIKKGWIPNGTLPASLAFVEGRHGISGIVSGKRVYLPPSEFIRNNKYGSFMPMPGYDRNFKIGVDIDKLKKSILHQGRQIGVKGKEVDELERFESLSVVEGADYTPKRLWKSTLERGVVTRSSIRDSVLLGAEYLSKVLKSDGLFHYHYNPVRDRDEEGAYNWPRHAGCAYGLALVGRLLGDRSSLNTAKKALLRFERQLTDSSQGSKCLMSDGTCYLGSSALGLLALSEYRIASGDTSFDSAAKSVAQFIESMKKPGELFYHDWSPKKGIDRNLMKLYASSQAVFALARYAKAYSDKEALDIAVKGMDYLAGPYWDHFLGSYFFGLEHWTCLAAEEVFNAKPKPEYAELCAAIGKHYDNITHGFGETPFPENVGGMSITHLVTPHLGGTATATEAMVSAVVLGNALHLDTSKLREQLKASFGFFMQTQVTADDVFWIKRADYSMGGFYESQSKPKIRIDNIQHAMCAMARGMQFID